MRKISYSNGTIYATSRPLGILGTIAAAIGLVVAAVFGAAFFIVLMGVVLVVGLIVAARIWWTTRELRAELRRSGATLNDALRQQAQTREHPPGPQNKTRGQTIEGEFREVDQ